MELFCTRFNQKNAKEKKITLDTAKEKCSVIIKITKVKQL